MIHKNMFSLKESPQAPFPLLIQGCALYKQSFCSFFFLSFLASLIIFLPEYLYLFFTEPTQSTHSIHILIIASSWLLSLLFLGSLIFKLYCYCYQFPCKWHHALLQSAIKFFPLLQLSFVYAIVIASATLMLLLPGLFFAFSFMFAFIFMMTEEKDVFQSLTASHQLVAKQWWHTFSVMSIPLTLNLTVLFSFFVLLAYIAAKYALPFPTVLLIHFLSSLLIQALFIPLIFSIAITLLHDLKQRQVLQKTQPY